MLPKDDRVIETCRRVLCFNVYFRFINLNTCAFVGELIK